MHYALTASLLASSFYLSTSHGELLGAFDVNKLTL